MNSYKKIYSQVTVIGKLTIEQEHDFITRVYLHYENIPEDRIFEKTLLLKEAFQQLDFYFARKLEVFSLPLKFVGTAFMQKVWDKLLEIPYAAISTYKDIAIAVGSSKACRAVGLANNKNPIPIFAAWHRVVGASLALKQYKKKICKNGDELGYVQLNSLFDLDKDINLVGYAGGLSLKRQLLDLENN